jgi:hypothetical protein
VGSFEPDEFEVKHNRAEEEIIWSWLSGFVVHEKVLEGFNREGFTGYRVNPAKVRFRDGSISTEYREFIVTGWAGIATPQSGVRLLKSCSACPRKEYSGVTNFEDVIDWSQWTGEDFFIAWPMATRKLVSNRVAEWLLSRKVKSVRLEKGFAELERQVILQKFGFRTGRLSDYLPDDLAIKYGRPLGLE